MLAVLVVAVVLAVVLLLHGPLERLGARLQDGSAAPRARPQRRGPARRLRALHPRAWDLAGRAERRRLARLPLLPVDDRPPRAAGPAPSSPRALALELRRGLDDLTLHLATEALQQHGPGAAAADAPAHDPAVPAGPVPAQQDRRSRTRPGSRRDAREDA